MLLRASRSSDKRYMDIFTSTSAILFLGTPHAGSPHAELGEILRNITRAIGFDSAGQNLVALRPDSSLLEQCREDFYLLYKTGAFEVYTFQEAKGLTGTSFGPFRDKVLASSQYVPWCYNSPILRSSQISPLISWVPKRGSQLMQIIGQCADFQAKTTTVTWKSVENFCMSREKLRKWREKSRWQPMQKWIRPLNVSTYRVSCRVWIDLVVFSWIFAESKPNLVEIYSDYPFSFYRLTRLWRDGLSRARDQKSAYKFMQLDPRTPIIQRMDE